MDENQRATLRKNFSLRDTEDLLDIWQSGTTDEWEPASFEVIREILLERLGSLPQRDNALDFDLDRSLDTIDGLYQDDRLNEALIECNKTLLFVPAEAEPYHYRAVILEAQGRSDEAMADYRTALRLDPESKEIKENFTDLEKTYEEEFLRSKSKDSLDRALEYAYDGDEENTLQEIGLALVALPELSRAYNYLGLVRLVIERYEEAEQAFLKAIELNPHYSASYENLSFARRRLEEEKYHQASLKNPDEDPDANAWWREYDEEHLEDIPESDESLPGWMYLNEEAIMLRGFPGNRTRPGRFGTDQLDSSFEDAHVEGIIIRRLFTLRFRTKNPINLLVMSFMGLFFSAFLSIFLAGFISGDLFILAIGILYLPVTSLGLAYLLNVFLSLETIQSDEVGRDGDAFY
ncbi:MAG: tetratricopeptide repeat protein [Anaerolineaceae bacterium]